MLKIVGKKKLQIYIVQLMKQNIAAAGHVCLQARGRNRFESQLKEQPRISSIIFYNINIL